MTITISEVNISLIKPQNGLIGFASLILEGNFYIGSIGIHQRLDGSGYRLTYPTKRINNIEMNIYHPINKATSFAIEKAVMNKLKDVTSKQHVGYDSNNYE